MDPGGECVNECLAAYVSRAAVCIVVKVSYVALYALTRLIASLGPVGVSILLWNLVLPLFAFEESNCEGITRGRSTQNF